MPSNWENLRQSDLDAAKRQFAAIEGLLVKHLDDMLRANQQSVEILAEDVCVRDLFPAEAPAALETANTKLDLFRSTLGAEVCYLIDREGLVLASSNRGDQDSFVGKNYAFRTYFTEAIADRPTTFPALGFTSGSRGIYFSHPVTGAAPADRVGVVVIKLGADPLEEHFVSVPGLVALTDPDGMVMVSNRPDWRLRPLWRPTGDVRKRWEQSRQFGPGPWRGLGFERQGADVAVDAAGDGFWTLETPVVGMPGWRLRTFFDQKSLTSEMQERIGLEREREALIAELRESLAQVKTLNDLLPICAQCKKIRDDQGYWQQVEIYVHEHTDAQFTHGICPECTALLFPGVKVPTAPPAGGGEAAT